MAIVRPRTFANAKENKPVANQKPETRNQKSETTKPETTNQEPQLGVLFAIELGRIV